VLFTLLCVCVFFEIRYAFVKFNSPEEAQEGLSLNGYKYKGKELSVKPAVVDTPPPQCMYYSILVVISDAPIGDFADYPIT